MRISALLVLVPVFLASACMEDPQGPDRIAEEPPNMGKEAWWNDATHLSSGRERILAPRELRALLAGGRRRGYAEGAAWWAERRRWVSERVLQLDPEDVEANAALGRRTLRSLQGFGGLWERMLDATVRNEAIETLLDRFETALQEERAIFLTSDEVESVSARLREAGDHLDRLEHDPRYRAEQVTLGRVRNSVLGDYPFVHVTSGPFLILYTARDLQRIPGEDPEAEDRRLGPLRELYGKRLAERAKVYTALLDDISEHYPELWAKRAPKEGRMLLQWIFGDRSWYSDYVDRLPLRVAPVYDVRCGFVHEATNWAYLWEPEAPDSGDPDTVLRGEKEAESRLIESAAHLAAQQLLWEWAKDPEDPLINHLETSPDYWLKVGWAALLASRRVDKSAAGALLKAARDAGVELPSLVSVVERRSSIDPEGTLARGGMPPELGGQGDGFLDLALALVGHLVGERYHSAFERYLLSQIEGGRRGIRWFEECFDVQGSRGWRDLERAVYEGAR